MGKFHVSKHYLQACFFNIFEKTQAPKKLKVKKNSRKFKLKTQRNGSYGSDLNFRTRYFLKFLCSNMASHPKLHWKVNNFCWNLAKFCYYLTIYIIRLTLIQLLTPCNDPSFTLMPMNGSSCKGSFLKAGVSKCVVFTCLGV